MPNNLPQSKGEYVRKLCAGKPAGIASAALIFYHAEVPLEVALEYIRTLCDKQYGMGTSIRTTRPVCVEYSYPPHAAGNRYKNCVTLEEALKFLRGVRAAGGRACYYSN